MCYPAPMSSSRLSLPLHDAIARNEVERCLQLIEEGVDLDAVDLHGRTALRLACQQDAPQMRPVIQTLILKGSDLDATDNLGFSARLVGMGKEFEDPTHLSSWVHFFDGTLALLQAQQLDESAGPAKSTARRPTL
jgi:hypothetical protein